MNIFLLLGSHRPVTTVGRPTMQISGTWVPSPGSEERSCVALVLVRTVLLALKSPRLPLSVASVSPYRKNPILAVGGAGRRQLFVRGSLCPGWKRIPGKESGAARWTVSTFSDQGRSREANRSWMLQGSSVLVWLCLWCLTVLGGAYGA